MHANPGSLSRASKKIAQCAVVALFCAIFASVYAQARPFLYVANNLGDSVLVIDAATNKIVATIFGFGGPNGVAITPDGTRAYVTNSAGGSVSVISTATNKVTATIFGFGAPTGIAIKP
ncbi:MAG: YncE family protein [Terriglobia bacterium]